MKHLNTILIKRNRFTRRAVDVLILLEHRSSVVCLRCLLYSALAVISDQVRPMFSTSFGTLLFKTVSVCLTSSFLLVFIQVLFW